ncbi:asparagine synthase (glutamine-hydrolyzing) [Aestuariivivens marinum]|uniref:asparagine synthase (glutamine-hydrolyzing) n=1 Tax=Aestuariivivens marinum TaxID=2913555 RepID=UPI001F55B586|nr:asparagine synthase (glutamine-hydrolyzing) [Aestuariivivens marinum]
MCGFLTEFSFKGDLSNPDHFEVLLALSKHRGPDNTQIETGHNYRLGFNRLAIIDLSELGNQPMWSPSKRYHVVFNGEVYNYKTLQEQYQLHNLSSTSDTEVLVHLLDILGVHETLKVLNGMFALTVMDAQTQIIYLARDFAGIKSLFYGINDKGLVAASQFNQVFRHNWFKAQLELRPNVIKDYFGFGYMQAPNTIYENIYQVQPGTCICIDSLGELQQFSFCQFPDKINDHCEDNIESTVEQQLHDAVNRQLVSDVPLASFLSGGIDSPLITAIAKTHKPDIEGFTLSVDDQRLDEGFQASRYAEQLGMVHKVHRVTETNILNEVDHHFKYLSEPLGDFSSIPSYVITKAASKGHTVMLSGDGGDELFFGYPRMLDVIKKRCWFKVPFGIRKPLVRFSNKLGLTRTWAPYHYKTLDEFIQAKHTYIFKTDLDALFNNDIAFSEPIQLLYRFDSKRHSKALLAQLRYNEFYGHLQRVLKKVDLMSMANSMEVRVPFLDKEVIKVAFQYLPKSFKAKKDLKRLLKTMMGNYFDATTINKDKQGFTVPLSDWLHQSLKQDVEQLVFNTPLYGASCLNEEAIKDYVKRFYNKTHDNDWGVWHVYAWQKWAKVQGLV